MVAFHVMIGSSTGSGCIFSRKCLVAKCLGNIKQIICQHEYNINLVLLLHAMLNPQSSFSPFAALSELQQHLHRRWNNVPLSNRRVHSVSREHHQVSQEPQRLPHLRFQVTACCMHGTATPFLSFSLTVSFSRIPLLSLSLPLSFLFYMNA